MNVPSYFKLLLLLWSGCLTARRLYEKVSYNLLGQTKDVKIGLDHLVGVIICIINFPMWTCLVNQYRSTETDCLLRLEMCSS